MRDLLNRWLAAYEAGGDLSAQDLCPDQPRLAEELRPTLEELRRVSRRAAELANGQVSGEDPPTLAVPTEAASNASPSGVPLPDGESPTGAPASLPPGVPPTEGVPGYEILGVLGRGGMGVVYKARQTRLGRIVALKMIRGGTHADESDLARFQTEAEAIARLQHPNIVQVHEVGEHEGRPFFSLEFCDGSLDKKLAGNPLPPEQASALVETLALAMQAAHQAHVIHRDLKPGNVLLSADGTPKITDFGLAKKLDEAGQTQTGEVMGTPSYMAPEQAGGRSKEIGPLADVYALGAILYECLTGRPPFKAATMMDTLMQVMSEEPVPPRQLNAKVPVDLETVCLKCLHKEPAKRYATAGDLAEDLARWQRGEPVVTRPVGMAERAWRWCRRNPAVASLMTLAVVLLLAGASISTVFAFAAAEKARQAEASTKREKRLAEERAAALEEVAAEKRKVESELAKAEFDAYAFRLREAQAEIERGRVDQAAAVLRLCDPKLRGWEHGYLWRQTQHCLRTKNRQRLCGVWQSAATASASSAAVGTIR